MSIDNGYVVCGCEHLRDGTEDFAKCFTTLTKALEYINKHRFARGNYEFHLFELGEEIALTTVETEVPQPPIKTTEVVVKDG